MSITFLEKEFTMACPEDDPLLGRIVIMLDHIINRYDTAVFEAAYGPGDLEAQRARAMDSAFQSPIKTQRDKYLSARNEVAERIGLAARAPHDLSPRDYLIENDLPVRVG